MNRKHKLNRNSRRRNRAGISLFEVLISILVAAIGVFGVILLIPFAWETAERGIDRENAINAAKNYFADVQTYGYHRTDSWFDDVVQDQRDPASPNVDPHFHQPDAATLIAAGPPFVETGSNIVAGWPYVLDPIGAVDSTTGYGLFPSSTNFSSAGTLPQINRINLQNANGNAFDAALARRLCWKQDDLVFKKPDNELGPPRQAYFGLDTLNDVKRQYDGRYAMISFMVPKDDDRNTYQMFTLVGKAGDRDRERVFIVDTPAQKGNGSRGYEGILLGGGDVALTEAPPPESAPDPSKPIEDHQIRNGDWIMLINYYRTDMTQNPAVDPMYDDVQINFYQVLNASKVDLDPVTGRNDYRHTVTLQGPDFDVFRDWNDRTPGQITQTFSYAVLIPNVLTVYERTFRTEQPSTWTNN